MKIHPSLLKATKNGRQTTKLLKPTLLAFAVMQCATAQAATIHVGGELGRGCGLQSAILSANNDAAPSGSPCADGDGDDVIELNRDVTLSKAFRERVNGTLTDTANGTPLITSNVTINGNGNRLSRAQGAPRFRLLDAAADSTLTVRDLKLVNGKAPFIRSDPDPYPSRYDDLDFSDRGGAIRAAGNLNISDSRISSSENAVFAEKFTRIVDTTFVNNRPSSKTTTSALNLKSAQRAPSALESALYIKGSTFERNSGEHVVRVETTYLDRYDYSQTGSVSVVDSTIKDNSGIGLGIWASLNVDIRNSSFTNNSNKALVISASSGTITDSVISDNVAESCAGITVRASEIKDVPLLSRITISNSSISDNTSRADGGGLCSLALDSAFLGGTVRLSLENSTISGNKAGGNGGGIFADSQKAGSYGPSNNGLTLVNTTVSTNQADLSGGGIFLRARAFDYYYNYQYNFAIPPKRDTRLTLINSTVVSNSATVQSGGIEGQAAYLNFRNSIVAGNVSAGSANEIRSFTRADFAGKPALVATGNNLLGDSQSTNAEAFSGFEPNDELLTQFSDITSTSDGLVPASIESIVGPLANNGGLTFTHALPAGSPAVNNGSNEVCSDPEVNGLDQRGESRPVSFQQFGDDRQCDIGAYEVSTDDKALPEIRLRDITVLESDKRALVRIDLSKPQIEKVRVNYRTVDGTANDGLDYVGRSGGLTFAPGQTSKVRAIKLINDDLSEIIESFTVRLSNPVGARLEEPEGDVRVIDDDGQPVVSVEPMTVNVKEGARVATYRLTLTSPRPEKITVSYRTEDVTAKAGLDYVERRGSVTFAVGQTTKTRNIEILQDDVTESAERFRFILSDPDGAILGKSSAEGVIIDDD